MDIIKRFELSIRRTCGLIGLSRTSFNYQRVPSARQIVDYWHVCQHISECATALYGLDSVDGHHWRRTYCHMLREDGPNKLLRSLRLSKRQRQSNPQKQALSALLRFLKSRIDRIDYPTPLSRGYRVDSGPIESSCKTG